MIGKLDEREIEKIAREKSLVGLIERERHTPPFPMEVWGHFYLLSVVRKQFAGRTQLIGEYGPASERAHDEAVKYLQETGVLTTVDDGAYVVFGTDEEVFNPRTPHGKTLYFVNKKDAEQYSLLWTHSESRDLRVRKLSSE